MWVVFDTDTGWSEEDWRFANLFDASAMIGKLNMAADYDHYEMRWEN